MASYIVPFDAKKRGAEERATMMEKLGFKHFACDYRAEYIVPLAVSNPAGE